MHSNETVLITELAHAIQNQLSLISGHASILGVRPRRSSDEEQSLAKIRKAALEAGQAVRELAEISLRLSRGQ